MNKLIYLHNPKTGGTTLRLIILKNYNKNYVITDYSSKIYPGSIQELKKLFKKKQVLIGHFPFGFYKNFPKPFKHITLLRNPVDLIISLYNHLLRDTKHPLHKKMKNLSLKEFVIKNLEGRTSNPQTKMIGVELRFIKNEVFKLVCSLALLKKAKKHLSENFDAFGLTERFDESLILFKRLLGWKKVTYTKRSVSKNKPAKIDKETIDLIKRYNKFDLELYEFAKKLFEKRIKEQGPSFYKELKKLKFYNSMFCYIYKIKSKILFPFKKIKLKIKKILKKVFYNTK